MYLFTTWYLNRQFFSVAPNIGDANEPTTDGFH